MFLKGSECLTLAHPIYETLQIFGFKIYYSIKVSTSLQVYWEIVENPLYRH